MSNYSQYISTAVGNGALPQYPYDLSGVKYKTLSDILTLQRQWNTFDRIQNLNFGVYLSNLQGKPQNWYSFISNQEASDFRVGQQLHTNRFPNIPPVFFQQVSLLPIPTSSNLTGPPRFSQAQPQINSPPPLTEGQKTENNADMAIYTYVSTYNIMHSTFTYQFQSNEEQLAYYRALRRILSIPSSIPVPNPNG